MRNIHVIMRADTNEDGIIDGRSPFIDLDGFCYYGLLYEQDDPFIAAYTNNISDNSYSSVTITIIEKESNRICGFYPDGILYADSQWNQKANCTYHAKCKTKHVVFLSPDDRPVLPFPIHKEDFFFFPENRLYPALDNLLLNARRNAKEGRLILYPPDTQLLSDPRIEDLTALYKCYRETDDSALLPLIILSSQKAIKKDKNDCFAIYSYAYALMQLAKPDMALEIIEPLLQANPTYVNALYIKGIAQMHVNQLSEAINTLNKALSIEDENDIRYYLAQAYDWSGYAGTAYRMLKSIRGQEWEKFVKPMVEEMEKALPHIVSGTGAAKLPPPYPLPWIIPTRTKTYIDSEGKERYACVIRDKGVMATPEEWVRQEFALHLIKDLGYPKQSILMEESLAHVDRSLRDRVDILVAVRSVRKLHNLMMVECKAKHVPLDGSATEQAVRYNRVLEADYIVLTNGIETHIYYFDKKEKNYALAPAIPKYEELISQSKISHPPIPDYHWIRPDYSSLSELDIQQRYLGIYLGGNTSKIMKPVILNIAFMLLDDSHRLCCPISSFPFVVIKDNGLTTQSPGNPSGHGYHGTFRWFSVQDEQKIIYQVYIGLFGMAWVEHPPDELGGKNMLMVAVDKGGKAISVLQIDLDKHLTPLTSGYELTHSGVRSRAKIVDLLPHIQRRAPHLLGGKEKITLGTLDTSRNLILSDPQTAKVIANIISYALIRFNLRKSN